MTKLRLRWKRVATVLPLAVRFGALTVAGAGGVPVTGTAIVSGDPSGHFQISGGYLTVSPTGDGADLNAGPYAIVLDDGSALTVSIDANAWDVRTQAEWDTTITQTTAMLSGKKIFLRPDSYRGGASITTGVDGGSTAPTRLRRADFGGLVIEGRTAAIDSSVFPPARAADPCTIDKVLLRGARNITFRKLATTRVAENKFRVNIEASFPVYGIWIDQCHVSGAVGDPQGDYSISTNYPNYGIDLISYTSSGPGNAGGNKFTNNVVEWGDALINTSADRAGDYTVTVTGNFLRYAYSDCIKIGGGQLSPVTCIVEDNIGMDRVGKSSDDKNPHGDFFQFGAVTTTSAGPPATTATAYDITVSFQRNRMIGGTARGGTMQGLFLSDMPTGSGSDPAVYYIATVTGNFYAADNVNAIVIDQAKNCVVRNNTVVDKATTPASVNTPTIRVGSSTSSGTHIVERNVADAIGYPVGTTESDNVVLGQQGSVKPYGTVFAGSAFETLTDLATIMATYAPKSGGPLDLGTSPDVGAIASGAVTFPTTVPGDDGVTLVA